MCYETTIYKNIVLLFGIKIVMISDVSKNAYEKNHNVNIIFINITGLYVVVILIVFINFFIN